MHELAALRELGDVMMKIERQRAEWIKRGSNPVGADRYAAQIALTVVAEFFATVAIESRPIVRLLSEIVAISAGSRLSDMLTPEINSHRPSDPPTIEAIKGRLAAIMEYRQHGGLARKAAAAWVVQHLPAAMRPRLRSPRPTTVDSWLTKWGGERGAAVGPGRDGYLHMRAILATRKPTAPQLKRVMDVFVGYLPPSKSK